MEITDFKEKLKGICEDLRFPKPKVVSEGLVTIKVRINFLPLIVTIGIGLAFQRRF